MMFETSQQAKLYFMSLLFMISPDKPIVIVEGTTDYMALRNVFKATILPVYDPHAKIDPGFTVTNNRQLVVEMARWLRQEKKPRHENFVAIIDADYDRIDSVLDEETNNGMLSLERQYEKIHVFLTDWHDLDVHVFFATIDDFIDRKLRKNAFRPFVMKKRIGRYDWKDALREILFEAALQIGLVRLTLHRHHISQRVIPKQVSNAKFIDTELNVMIDDAIAAAVEGTNYDLSTIRSEYDRLSSDDRMKGTSNMDVYLNVINGHDLLRILGLCIIGRHGSKPATLNWAEKSVPIIMRKTYSLEHFRNSKLYQRLSRFMDLLF